MQLYTAIDIENGQAFGPFRSHEAADEQVMHFLLEVGEWRIGSDSFDADLRTAIEHFIDPEAGTYGHKNRDECRDKLCTAIDELGWLVQPLADLPAKRSEWSQLVEAHERLAEDWYEGQLESESPEEIVAHAWRVFKYGAASQINDSAMSKPHDQDHAYLCVVPSCPKYVGDAKMQHVDHGHGPEDGADGRDVHAS